MRIMSMRREVAFQLQEELGTDLPEFATAAHMAEGAAIVGKRLRQLLGVTISEQFGWRDEWEAWRRWRGLRFAGALSWEGYQRWKAAWGEYVATLKPRKGGFATPVEKTLGRAGRPFAELVLEALDTNRITAVDASRYLDLRFDHVALLRDDCEIDQPVTSVQTSESEAERCIRSTPAYSWTRIAAAL